MTRPYVPASRLDQTFELPEPPAPTQLALPAKVLAAMAEELPRDAIQSLVDDTDAESIDADVVMDSDDDEVTHHGVPPDAPSWQGDHRRSELGDLEREISAFRSRSDGATQELDAVFGTSPDSRRGRSAQPTGHTIPPPPPPSKKLNAFASRMLFEPTPAPLEASFLPPPAVFAPPSERPGAPSSYRPPPPPSHGGHSDPFGVTSVSAYSNDPFAHAARHNSDEVEEETETRVLMRFDPAVAAQALPPVPVPVFPPHSFGPASYPAPTSYSSVPPPNSGPQSVPPQTMSRLPSAPSVPLRGPTAWLSIAGAGLLGASAIALAAYAFNPKTGELIVDVANQACNIVSNVNVYVDNELACTNTPCRLETAARSHVIYAEAEGYPRTPAESVMVESGSVTLHKLQLGAGVETGVEVRTRISGLTLTIDGKPVGDLPRRVPGLSPGEHVLRIEGGENYFPEERKVTVANNEMLVLPPVEPKLRLGTLEVVVPERLRDAKVTINDKRVDVPYLQRLDASGRYHIVAQKAGYETFDTWIGFDSGMPKQHVDLQLVARHDSAPSAPAPRQAERSFTRSTAASFSSGSGEATLNLNSKPMAMVLLDGKPLGQTPRMGISVKPGTHTVIFVGPDSERKRMTATVGAGATKTVAVRF